MMCFDAPKRGTVSIYRRVHSPYPLLTLPHCHRAHTYIPFVVDKGQFNEGPQHASDTSHSMHAHTNQFEPLSSLKVI